ncbi:MAG: hypothetical protein HPY64_17560 [Anaerolineae bacterium]|nr:hypothetical protein [Anaerolineae bacterium]
MTAAPRFHLFLSPHLDDAVLSCGGLIHRLVAAGERVAVHTIMAGRPPRPLPQSPILADLHARWATIGDPIDTRRREDIRALSQLGALARHAAIPDCVYRVTYTPAGEPVALYPSEESLWAAIHPVDTAPLLLDATPLLYPQTDVLHIPLGAGGHVDHRLVRDWGRRLARANPGLDVFYYEEYPYSLNQGAVEAALAAFNPPPDLAPILHLLDDDALAAKIAAIACYESQISTFWRDATDMADAVRRDALAIGGGIPAEREWQPRG